MNLKNIVEILNFGQFSKPFLNYMGEYLKNESTKQHEEVINYIDVLKLKWAAKYEEALEKIEKAITLSKKRSIDYLLLVEKMDVLVKLSKEKEIKETFYELRNGFSKLPRYLRGVVVESLRNIRELYYESNESIEKVRHWSEEYENNPVDKGFILMADAREKKNEGRYEEATQLNIEAFKILKDVPHPSGIVQALNNISWWLKDVDKSIALNLSLGLGFYLGYYFDNDNFNVFNSLDTIFQVQKESNDPMMYETAYIFSKYLSKVDKERYNILKKQCGKSINQLKYCVFNLDNRYYLNTKTLRDFLKQEIENGQVPIKELNISKRTLNDFLSGKTKQIKPNTLRNIINNLEFEINTSLAIPIVKELKKKDIDKKFEENFYKFMQLRVENQLSEFFTSYLVHYHRQEVKLEKVIKEIESESLIKERCGYYTRELINSIFEKTLKIGVDSLLINNQRLKSKTFTNKDITFKEHPYYSARKILVKRFMKDLNKTYLQEFIEKYIKLDSNQKEIIEKFIMNYGRYYEIRNIPKELRPKVPKEINVFVKKYTLKRRLSATSFYIFEGEEREKIVETLKAFA
ncbi:hypothetical protein HWHPT5561_03230 [Petrotoga sp. HWH.PT.55.6.1]|uniref:hypothetical protein n=1 Tax=unclassified Petrotoga TaxID=2620614 RepID=UPI000CA00EE3|nr:MULTISPECIES: hypothetical protein [unclassified Petrotoga]PNR92909.1 hypothetical protein X926_05045 [Petrotoga sp. HWHPT.55.6.3]RPD36151.1 hypothetical protein HWHPT5561_03230 [Petrotoga sp. HWH.PT.55.6.1]